MLYFHCACAADMIACSIVLLSLPPLSPLQPQCVSRSACCLLPGPWSSMPEPVHSSDQDTYKWPPLPFSAGCCGGWAYFNNRHKSHCAQHAPLYIMSSIFVCLSLACHPCVFQLCFCDGSIFPVCRSVCWGLDLPFSCSSHVSSNSGSWESLVNFISYLILDTSGVGFQ